jgi:hypothetical protein
VLDSLELALRAKRKSPQTVEVYRVGVLTFLAGARRRANRRDWTAVAQVHPVCAASGKRQRRS